MSNPNNNNHYFDSDTAREELVKMTILRATNPNVVIKTKTGRNIIKRINTPSNKLVLMISELHSRMANSTRYSGYPAWVIEEMTSKAMYDFLLWGHNYDPDGSAYSFLTACASNSFKRTLKIYYKGKNLEDTIRLGVDLVVEINGINLDSEEE